MERIADDRGSAITVILLKSPHQIQGMGMPCREPLKVKGRRIKWCRSLRSLEWKVRQSGRDDVCLRDNRGEVASHR
jgi:hypothetical protein